jgi:hypothetical protein
MAKNKTARAGANDAAILDTLKLAGSPASVAQIAVSAGIGRSTAGKLLSRLANEGKITRAPGGRDGNRRLPDLYTLNTDTAGKPVASPGKLSTGGGQCVLKAGELEPLVLAFLAERRDSSPHGPVAVAAGLARSSGAVSNCLDRLTSARKVKRVSDKPRRYQLAA